MIYIICFFASSFLIWLGSEKKRKFVAYSGTAIYIKRKKRLRASNAKIIFIILGLLIPCILAALRDITVGSDVQVYVVQYFIRAGYAPTFGAYLRILKNYDFGYAIINFIVSRFTDNIGWLFFINELLIIGFSFAGCWVLREEAPVYMSMLFYYLIFYNMTLSTVRQSITCAICFYIIALCCKKHFEDAIFLKCLPLLIFACTIHATAVIALLMLLLFWLVQNKRLHVGRFSIIVVLAFIVFRVLGNYFLSAMARLVSIISVKYSTGNFLKGNGAGASGFSSIIILSIFVCLIQYFVMRQRSKIHDRSFNKALLILEVIYVVGMLLLSVYEFIPRLFYYTQMFWCISLAQSSKIVKKERFDRYLMTGITIAVVVVYWYYFFIYSGVHQTYPYVLR